MAESDIKETAEVGNMEPAGIVALGSDELAGAAAAASSRVLPFG